MNKAGLKTFVFSFGLTLSTILGVDRVFFYTPEIPKEVLKIPHKNITLFFNHSHPVVFSSQTEPVGKSVLETPKIKSEELEIAQNIPQLPENLVVRENILWQEEEDIPIQVALAEEKEDVSEKQADKKSEIPDVPLIYSGAEKKVESVRNAQKEVVEPNSPQKLVSIEKIPTEGPSEVTDGDELLSQPKIIQGTRQIIKIDNFKEYQEKLQKQKKEDSSALDILLSKKMEEIPLQNTSTQPKGEKVVPAENQIASLGGEIPIKEVEDQVKKNDVAEKKWQTMSEKHQGENPWLVARGNKYVKNKKLLKEEFVSEKAQEKAKILLSKNKENKSVKVAVQDNILIPIPQEILDEDNLVPKLGDEEKNKEIQKDKKKKKSFLDSITSVFSKENKQKAIKNIKERSDKNKKATKDDVQLQILPTEIRLSFQPNRAEISGQTLRWIQAFAKKSVEEDNVGLEIRIDGSKSFELQQKRLNLLYNILTANGVPYEKINTLFVDREPNSFVVRTVKILNGNEQKKENDSWKKYYQKW